MIQGKVCVSVRSANAEEAASAVQPILDLVDVVEIRLDKMTVSQVAKCCSLLPVPLLFTNRPTWEGGEFAGPEEQRLEPLLEAVRLKAAYVDLELRAEKALRKQLLADVQCSPTRLILSWHDFNSTPGAGELNDLLEQMHRSGADIGKIITTAHDEGDVLRVLGLQEKARVLGFPLSCFCMGECGRISRFASLYLGGFMSYVAVDKVQATAPGQFSANRFHKLRTLFSYAD